MPACPICKKNCTRRFCSRKCAGLFGSLKSRYNKRTGIEIKMAKLLTKLGINYEEQKVVPSCRCIPDFYLIDYNTFLMVDGTYWHSKSRRQYKDAQINKKLMKAGFEVLRYDEETINKNISWIAQDLKTNLGLYK